MIKFEDHLSRARGAVSNVDLGDIFERRRGSSLYYWNKASDLHAGALVIEAVGTPQFPITPADLDLGEGFAFGAALPPVFALLAGLSLELLLKAIAKALGLPDKHTHSLNRLREAVGIDVSADQIATLDALTEAIIWNSKYPTPKDREAWERAEEISERLRGKGSSLASYYNPDRAIDFRNYGRIWGSFAARYWQVKDAIFGG